ncbi:MAG TPA: alanine racemase [Thermoanaerobaculia bacterium]|nr:alanine racemase [Thermoanaerobaculia bacterium]
MTQGPRLSWVEVDLGAIGDNFEASRVAAAVDLFAVVKADAYGHGAAPVARALAGRPGLRGFVVARVEEGEALRAAGVEGEVLVLTPGLAAADGADAAARLERGRLTPNLGSLADVEALAAVVGADRGTRRPVHLEVDTGMARAGVGAPELGRALEAIRRSPGLVLEGLSTHLAESEAEDLGFTDEQLRRLREAVDRLTPEERGRVLVHAANSAAALDLAAARFGAARVGGALYGLDLAAPRRRGATDGPAIRLRPALRVVSRVAQVRELGAGSPVGYGRRFVAPRPTRIALVPIGYADGLPSSLAGRADVLVAGARCPVVGAISMDLITVDVGDRRCRPGDPVVVLGEQGGEAITAAEIAARGGDVLYEVTCRFSRRLERVVVGGPQLDINPAPDPRR